MGIVRKFRKLTLHLLATANILVVAALIATGYAGHVSPATHPNFEVLALAFPIPLLMNLAFGGTWGGSMGIDEGCLPARFEVDYVRVYQSPEILEMTGQTVQ